MKKITFFTTLTVILMLAASCGQPSKTTPTVYAVGETRSDDGYSTSTAFLWIDGTPTTFTDKSSLHSVFGSKEGIVYIAGYEDLHASLWKIERGKTSQIVLSDTHTLGLSGFATEQGEVYVVGNDYEDNNVAACWKVSGTKVTKMPLALRGGGWDSEAWSVWVAPDGKVYVAGVEGDFVEDDCKAVLWIDGEKQILPDQKLSAYAYAVYGNSQGDIYVAGRLSSSESQAVLWKNGVIQYLAKEAEESWATALFVTSNGDVYVGGEVVEDDSHSQAVIWKNGIKEYLPEGGDVKAIYVTREGDVYVAGTAYAPASGLWKNGVLQPVTQNSRRGAYLTGVFVK